VTHPTPPKPTNLVAWRTQLDQAKGDYALLDTLISPADAQSLVRQLPSEDLHAFIHRIGLADCTELLALANSEQVRDILDLEIWEKDQLSVERIDPWLQSLMRSGPDVLGPRLLALDDEILGWIVRRTAIAVVLENPDDFSPPEEEHVVTPDGRLLVMFPHRAERDLPAKIFLDWLMRTDAEHCINLLLSSTIALDSNLQHDAHHWRSARMADRGYVDYYDALVIYAAPPKVPVARSHPKTKGSESHRWLASAASGDRLDAAFAELEPDELASVQGELGYVANMILSADRIEAWDFDGQEVALKRLRAGLMLGLQVLGGHDAETDADLLYEDALSLIFRHGYARMLQAAAPARAVRAALRSEANPLAAVDLRALTPWAEALLVDRHPHRLDGAPLSNEADLQEARRAAEQIATLVAVAGPTRPAEVGLATWLTTQFTLHLLGLSGDVLPVDQLVHAHKALFVGPGQIAPDTRAAAIIWWADRGGDDATLTLLLNEMTAELGHINAGALEPRFLRLLRVGSPS
jgi:hypothetical protein